MSYEIGRGIFPGEVAPIEDHLDLHPSFVRIHQCLCNRSRGEGVGLDQHGLLGGS